MTDTTHSAVEAVARALHASLDANSPVDLRIVARAAIAAMPPQAPGWRPISEAPKDGSKFDAWVPSRFGGYRMADLSFNSRGQLRQHGLLTAAELPCWPTHFRPLPAPPLESDDG